MKVWHGKDCGNTEFPVVIPHVVEQEPTQSDDVSCGLYCIAKVVEYVYGNGALSGSITDTGLQNYRLFLLSEMVCNPIRAEVKQFNLNRTMMPQKH